MAGHSHWAGIKYKKALQDKRRGKLFSKISKKIMQAARNGGGDPDMNLELRYALDEARDANMPKDNVERAVKRGLGELPGATFEPAVYEGYGPGGVAIMVEALTDNRNRTVSEVRKIFDRHGGSLGESGCVAWMFERKGLITVEEHPSGEGDEEDAGPVDEDELMLAAMEAGADDLEKLEGLYEITTEVRILSDVKDALEDAGFEVKAARPQNVPRSNVDLDAENGRKVLSLVEELDDHDDVQNVYSNFNVPDELMAEMAEG